MTNTDDNQKVIRIDGLFGEAAHQSLIPLRLVHRIGMLRDETQELLVRFMDDHSESLNDLAPDLKSFAIGCMVELVALETASALLLAANQHEFEVAVEYATETMTATVIKEFGERIAAQEAVMEEFYKEWQRGERLNSNTLGAAETNPTKKARPFVTKPRTNTPKTKS